MNLVKTVGSKKVNLEFNKDFINLFSDKIKSTDIFKYTSVWFMLWRLLKIE